MRVALDQNFPTKLLLSLELYWPPTVQARHVHKVDPALSEIDDHELVVELSMRGFDVLVSDDYRMLEDVRTMSALVATKLHLVAIEAAGHDPLKATGLLLLELPTLQHRLSARESQILRVPKRQATKPQASWTEIQRLADRDEVEPSVLYESHRPHRT